MRDRLDPLIAERAPWLFARSPQARLARAVLDRLLAYERSVELATAYRDMPAPDVMADISARIARKTEIAGLEHVPATGPALIVANHPTGIADGIVLWSLLRARRPDMFIYANSDILRILPQFADLIVPVEWRLDKRTHARTRETMRMTRAALAQGRVGVIFPSGRLAKRRGLGLHEREWMPSAAMIARKFGLPVVPVHIRARNSALFYGFDALHPTLRDITLFHETLNKYRQPFRLRMGKPLDGAALPRDAAAGIALLRESTMRLGDDRTGEIRLSSARPSLPAFGARKPV
jgi:putative hemolysin